MRNRKLEVGKTYKNPKGRTRRIVKIEPAGLIYDNAEYIEYEDQFGKKNCCQCWIFRKWLTMRGVELVANATV